MDPESRYEHALAAALTILNEISRLHDMPQHESLAIVVFTILHAMDAYESERRYGRVEFSVN